MISGAWVQLMMKVSNDIPVNLPGADLVDWVCWQWWVMFIVTGLPILFWDGVFVHKTHDTTVEELRGALKDAKSEIRDLQSRTDGE